MAPLMAKFFAQHNKANEITESKISADIASIREKYVLTPQTEEVYLLDE